MPEKQKVEADRPQFEPLIVTMRVFDVKTDKEIRMRTFNYNDLELRKWYGKTVIWALMHGHAVELVRADVDQ